MAYITEAQYKELFSKEQYETYIQRSMSTTAATARFEMLSAIADDKINSIINMRYDTEELQDETPEILTYYAGCLINYYSTHLLGNVKDADTKLYEDTVSGLKDFRNSRAEIMDSDNEITDEYYSKRVYSAGGNTKSNKDVEHINKYF